MKLGPTKRGTKNRITSLDDAWDDLEPSEVDFTPETKTKVCNGVGIKYDMEKPDYSLVPPNALDDVVKILTLGAQKYDRHNWKKVENAKSRYFAAAMRHMWAWLRGETADPESGLSHCAHALCCIMFILELEHENLDP